MLQNLWYTRTDVFPLAFTKQVDGAENTKNLVSIPVSLGAIYHCCIKISSNSKRPNLLLFVTVSKDFWYDQFYFYSHVFFPVTKNFDIGQEQKVCGDWCSNINSVNGLYVLSTMSTSKPLCSCMDYAVSESQARFKEVSFHAALSTDSLNTSITQEKLPMINLKLMTYNIWNFNPYDDTQLYHKRISRLLKV